MGILFKALCSLDNSKRRWNCQVQTPNFNFYSRRELAKTEEFILKFEAFSFFVIQSKDQGNQQNFYFTDQLI